jgi:hypothetical protein
MDGRERLGLRAVHRSPKMRSGGDVGKRLAGWVVLVAVGVSIVDVVITYVAVHRGWGREQNPLAITAMEQIGLGPTLAGGLALRIAVAAGLALIGTAAAHHLARRAAATVLGIVTAWWMLIALNGVMVSTRA